MKNMNDLISAVAAAYATTEEDVRVSLRAYFDHLMEDPDFRAAWEEIPGTEEFDEVEALLGVMIAENMNSEKTI